MSAVPVMVINGPIRERIGLRSGRNALGGGVENRANLTIGRAVRLLVPPPASMHCLCLSLSLSLRLCVCVPLCVPLCAHVSHIFWAEQVQNVGGAKPGFSEMATMGSAMKMLATTFGEWEEYAEGWTPLHVER